MNRAGHLQVLGVVSRGQVDLLPPPPNEANIAYSGCTKLGHIDKTQPPGAHLQA